MGFCIWGISFLSCGMQGLFRLFINLFFPGMPSFVLFFISLIVSSIAIYLTAKLVGVIGGIIMTILGIVGFVFTAGVSTVLVVLGIAMTVVMFVFKKPSLLIILNIAMFLVCALCYGL